MVVPFLFFYHFCPSVGRGVGVRWRVLGVTNEKSVNTVSMLCRNVVNNINKNASVKTLRPEWKAGLRPPEKPADFPIRPLQTCERATVES